MAILSSTSSSYLDGQVLTDIGTLLTQVTTWVTGNTYLAIFFTLGLIGVGIGVFKALKRMLRGA